MGEADFTSVLLFLYCIVGRIVSILLKYKQVLALTKGLVYVKHTLVCVLVSLLKERKENVNYSLYNVQVLLGRIKCKWYIFCVKEILTIMLYVIQESP